jgi:hypothetical protein
MYWIEDMLFIGPSKRELISGAEAAKGKEDIFLGGVPLL